MWKRALLAPLAICALAVSATVAHADRPADAGGGLEYGVPVVLDVKEVGQTTFISAAADGEIDGTFSGEIYEAYTVVHHAKTQFNTYRGVLEFDGVVTFDDGTELAGTLTIQTHGRQDPGMVFPTDEPWYMRWVIVEGGGELEHVQGHGSGVLNVLTLEYGGQVHISGH